MSVNHKQRQLLTYREALAEAMHRLQEHLQLSSFTDVPTVRQVASAIGSDEMNLIRVQAAIEKAQQSLLISEAFIQGLKIERKYLITNREVLIRLVR